MKNNKKIMFLSATFLVALTLTACGNLSDEDSVWNQTREEEIEIVADDDAMGGMTFTPGTFDGTSDIRGYGGPVSVSVTIDEDGSISDVEVTEHRESDGFYQRAFDHLIPLILSTGSTDVDVDAASGATYSAEALLDAVNNALGQAGGSGAQGATPAGANFTPGTFDSTSDIRGYGGPVSVSVTIDEDGNISAIEVTDHGESDGFYQRAFDNIIPLILEAGSTDVDVDAASGATYSAEALLDAVRNALNDAE